MSDRVKFSNVKKRAAKDKIVFGLVCLFSFLSMIPLFLIIWEVVSKDIKISIGVCLLRLHLLRWMPACKNEWGAHPRRNS